jgi:hypothetical protein
VDLVPATSIKQRRMFAIAEHHPEKLYAKNKGVLGMKKSQMHDFAAVSETDLPEKVEKVKKLRGK